MSVFDVTKMGDGESEIITSALELAAQEFDRRAMLPTISEGFERARVLACAQWLRDMAQDITTDQEAEWKRLAALNEQYNAAFIADIRKRRNRPSQLDG
jgi:hypothetical protein